MCGCCKRIARQSWDGYFRFRFAESLRLQRKTRAYGARLSPPADSRAFVAHTRASRLFVGLWYSFWTRLHQQFLTVKFWGFLQFLKPSNSKSSQGKSKLLLLSCRAVVGNLFTTTGQKRIVIFVTGRIHNSSKGTHSFHQCQFFPSGVLVGRTRITRGSHATCGP